ncbi:heme exporter protein CcmD [Deinococcus apachensis]|nr:heme exporter protein CcmD [Deinococcus apachensis]
MDKYAAYVIVVYVVTFVLLAAYLVWMWWKLRAVREEERK